MKSPEGYYQTATVGWVRIALQNSFCHLRRGATVEDGLAATVGKGGDTDTNAAIAGALLGAADGLGTIPPRWVMPVQACRPHKADLGALRLPAHDLLARRPRRGRRGPPGCEARI